MTALAAGITVDALASPAGHRPPARHRDAPLVAAFEQVDQNTPWKLTATLVQSWVPAGQSWEQEGLKLYDGRFYITAFDKTHHDSHLIVIRRNGSLVKDILLSDGNREHAGGIDVYGHSVYVPLAVDSPHSAADVLRVDTRTFRVTRLFAVTYDHVGGLTYDPVRRLLVGQDWDSRTFYEWTLTGKRLAQWRNPEDYVGYQDCQYVRYEKLLCSASPLGYQKLGGFDLIDLASPEHAILNGVPAMPGGAGNANEILATRVRGGVRLTDYDGSPGPIEQFTTVIPNSALAARNR